MILSPSQGCGEDIINPCETFRIVPGMGIRVQKILTVMHIPFHTSIKGTFRNIPKLDLLTELTLRVDGWIRLLFLCCKRSSVSHSLFCSISPTWDGHDTH